MSAFANAIVLSELSNAISILEKPHSELPEVKDSNGVIITDPRDKKLALVRQHIFTAGDIINLVEKVALTSEYTVQYAIESKYRIQLETAASQSLSKCDCASCREERGEKNQDGSTQPAEEFGFGSVVKRNRGLVH